MASLDPYWAAANLIDEASTPTLVQKAWKAIESLNDKADREALGEVLANRALALGLAETT